MAIGKTLLLFIMAFKTVILIKNTRIAVSPTAAFRAFSSVLWLH